MVLSNKKYYYIRGIRAFFLKKVYQIHTRLHANGNFLAGTKLPDTFNTSIKEEDEHGNDERQPSPDGDDEVVIAPKLSVPIEDRKDSLFDQNVGPPLDPTQLRNYKTIEQILLRMNRLCVHQSTGKERPHEQLLLRNMGVHTVVLDLLQIPYDHKEDVLMNEIIKLAHEFLQNFCLKNSANQALLHKHIDLFLNPGVSLSFFRVNDFTPSHSVEM